MPARVEAGARFSQIRKVEATLMSSQKMKSVTKSAAKTHPKAPAMYMQAATCCQRSSTCSAKMNPIRAWMAKTWAKTVDSVSTRPKPKVSPR